MQRPRNFHHRDKDDGSGISTRKRTGKNEKENGDSLTVTCKHAESEKDCPSSHPQARLGVRVERAKDPCTVDEVRCATHKVPRSSNFDYNIIT